ncbi:Fanconi anemia group F protein [Tachyglossus aculeatus]|uniref:Fanconi anemia group F protein n=1 Tax=Tachyglossus aculeatus TaxID=9261 RepID=UPI0018F311EC|nr:Fanconi anemia group F protein [Tachyglossus aculeatus]
MDGRAGRARGGRGFLGNGCQGGRKSRRPRPRWRRWRRLPLPAVMEPSSQQLSGFRDVLAASAGREAGGWDGRRVRRALRWARFLRRRRRGGGGLRAGPGLLALRLLSNRALPSAPLLPALLPPPPARPHDPGLQADVARGAAAAALLLHLQLQPGGAEEAMLQAEADVLLRQLQLQGTGPAPVAWQRLPPSRLCRHPAALALLCGLLAPRSLRLLGDRSPALGRAVSALLAGWASRLRFQPAEGRWVGDAPLGWAALRDRLRCLARAPGPLGGHVRDLLRTNRARDGDFQVPGISVWTDLLLDITVPGHEAQGAGAPDSSWTAPPEFRPRTTLPALYPES